MENKESVSQKPVNLDLSDLQDDENLVNFMENLDYDKYVKNQDVREALFLLKNKVDKEKVDNPEEENKSQIDAEENKSENYVEKNEENTVSLPPIDPRMIHEKDWDGKEQNDDDLLKKKMADKILKLDKVK